MVKETSRDPETRIISRTEYVYKKFVVWSKPILPLQVIPRVPWGTWITDHFIWGKGAWTDNKVESFQWNPVALARFGVRDLGFTVPSHRNKWERNRNELRGALIAPG